MLGGILKTEPNEVNKFGKRWKHKNHHEESTKEKNKSQDELTANKKAYSRNRWILKASKAQIIPTESLIKFKLWISKWYGVVFQIQRHKRMIFYKIFGREIFRFAMFAMVMRGAGGILKCT